MKIAILGILMLALSCNGYVIRCNDCPQLEKAITRGTLKLRTSASLPTSAATTTTTTTTTTPPPNTESTAVPTSTTTSAATASDATSTVSSSVGTTAVPTVSPAVDTEPVTVGGGVLGLASTLRKQLPARKNAVLSPLSIASVLAALQMGARGNTRRQIADLLGQRSSADEMYWAQLGAALNAINESTAITADLANAVILDKALSLAPEFENSVKRALSSEALTADFAGNPEEATTFINKWVSDKTHAKIPEILREPVDSSTILAVASALYFNGAWNEQFIKDDTRRQNFTVSDDEVVEVDMMFQETSALYAEDANTKVLGLPYKDLDFALFFLLPKEPGLAGLERLEASLTPAGLLELLSSADWYELPYAIPRMRIEASFELSEALINAGVKDMFDATKADLSGIFSQNNGSVPVFVNQVVHSVVMDVTESGTEAAAATVATSSRSGSRLEFRANRPFLFVLQHRLSGVPLFWGSIVRPTPNYPVTKQ